MMKSVSVLLLSLVVLSSAQPDWWTPPDFCHGLDCPPYHVTMQDNSSGIEYRDYIPAVLARTKIYDISYEDAVHQGFDLLFDYISGNNDQNISIEMTTPVDTQIVFSQGPFCQTLFIVSFFCPYKYQDPSNPPPKPGNPAVYIETVPEQRRAVYEFSGYVTSWAGWIQPSTYLFDYLDAENQSYNPKYEMTNEYDSPFRPIKRTNEVWATLE
uniref:Uncharacterized protein n=1 Tax=Paramoeba aestuarina TaxID=180227 RepID=A0A7S4L1L1_9EUKA|mmetsp:Transcript_29692/g.45886  ORF Transcript_29692/g.45886 Transcript_29692/m.45886 type:complete len:212 (+) Transcript_29692:45-680(+)